MASNSLVVAGAIELLGGGVSTNSICPGATYNLSPGWDLNAPQPTADFVASLLLDGERPFGRRASDRTITLPVTIRAPDLLTLATAREMLLQVINQQTWMLTWTRAGGLPFVIDCYRAQPTVVTYSLATQNVLCSQVEISFLAQPYGRSDYPVTADFPAPLNGKSAPVAPSVLDNYSTVTGAQWAQSANIAVGPNSAHWSPAIAPASNPTGRGLAAFYTHTFGAQNLTGMTAVTFWAGFGSTTYFAAWARAGGTVTFALTLTDGTNTIRAAKTKKVRGSNNSQSPVWTKMRLGIPQGITPFTYTAVTGYTLTVTSRGALDLPWTDLYLDDMLAVPLVRQSAGLTRGWIYDLSGIIGTARAPASWQFQQSGSLVPGSKKITIAGTGTWVAPAGVTTVQAECTGGGGAGSTVTSVFYGGGGGGGEYAANPAVAVTPGTAYSYSVGGGGYPGSGGNTYFTGDSATVTGHGGTAAPANSATAGAGGTGSSATTHFNGGAGGAGSSPDGGGGGGGAGSGSAGSAGGSGASGGAGGAGGTGSTTGGAGARGTYGLFPGQGGVTGTWPGGGGGGGQPNEAPGGAGAHGQLILTYLQTPQFRTLIAHRPGPDAPEMLAPYVTIGAGDTPNNGIEYPVPSLNPTLNARFSGTYSVVASNYSWSTPSNPRTITVTVTQYEQPGGASYTSTVSRTFTPSTDLTSPFVVLGEMTLPYKELPPDNLNAYYTVLINDTSTSDAFVEVLFLDTMGDTVMIESVTPYVNLYIDEPASDRDIGLISGSAFDRADSVSVLDVAKVAGGPLSLDPDANANRSLLVYASEGAPSVELTYYPRWHLDRLAD